MHVYGELSGVLTPAGTLSGTLSKPQTLSGELTIPETPAEGSATVSGSATVNPILSVNDEGVITATVDTTLSVTPDVVPGLITVGTPGSLVLSGNTEYQMYKRTSDDLVVNGQVVTAPNGYYPEDATKTVPIILKPTVLRPDAEIIETYHYDKMAVDDEGITLPSYSTSAKTIMASANLEPTITLEYDTYNYYIVERMVAIPQYSVTTKAKGRVEYYLGAYNYEIATVPGGTFTALVNGTTTISGRSVITGSVNIGRLFYWSSGSALALYSSTSTGLYMTPVAPTISSSVLTLKTPTCGTKGSGTYFSSTYANALTDVRYQYVFEVWRAPRNHMNIDGFGLEQSYRHMAACINTETHTLT